MWFIEVLGALFNEGGATAHAYSPKATHFTKCGKNVSRGSPWELVRDVGKIPLCEDCKRALLAEERT